MAYIIPITKWPDTHLMNSADLAQITDLVNYPPALVVEKTAVQSIATGTSWKNVTWDTAAINNDTMWALANPTALICRRPFTGRITAKVQWAAMTAATNSIDLQIIKTQGSVILGSNSGEGTTRADGQSLQVVSKPYAFSTDDLMLVRIRHGDSVSRNLILAGTNADGCWASFDFMHAGLFGSP